MNQEGWLAHQTLFGRDDSRRPLVTADSAMSSKLLRQHGRLDKASDRILKVAKNLATLDGPLISGGSICWKRFNTES